MITCVLIVIVVLLSLSSQLSLKSNQSCSLIFTGRKVHLGFCAASVTCSRASSLISFTINEKRKVICMFYPADSRLRRDKRMISSTHADTRHSFEETFFRCVPNFLASSFSLKQSVSVRDAMPCIGIMQSTERRMARLECSMQNRWRVKRITVLRETWEVIQERVVHPINCTFRKKMSVISWMHMKRHERRGVSRSCCERNKENQRRWHAIQYWEHKSLRGNHTKITLFFPFTREEKCLQSLWEG